MFITFYKEHSDLKSNYPHLFKIGEADSEDVSLQVSGIGISARQEFLEFYGSYTEMVYLYCNNDLLRVNEVFKVPANQFLFWCEYTFRKRQVDQIK